MLEKDFKTIYGGIAVSSKAMSLISIRIQGEICCKM